SLHHLLVASSRCQVRGHAGAQHALHRVLLQGPDPVVPNDADDRYPVSYQRVELHRREAESTVTGEQDHLPVRVRKLRGHGVGGPRSEGAERTRIDPQAWLRPLDEPPGEGDEVAAVADDD